MVYECERQREVRAPAQQVWDWLTVPHNVFGLNYFHHDMNGSHDQLHKGSVIPIQHRFFGLYQQRRFARIRAYRQYFLAWGEFAEAGVDRFPHSQSFTVIPIDHQRCRVVNRLRGKFVFPAAPYWLHPVYRFIGPWILDAENAKIAEVFSAREK